MHNRREIERWALKICLFHTSMILMFLYEAVKYGALVFLSSLQKSLKMSKKNFLTKFLEFKKQTANTLLLVGAGSLPILIMDMESVVKVVVKV